MTGCYAQAFAIVSDFRIRIYSRSFAVEAVVPLAAAQRITGWVQHDKERVALTCFERDACDCRRHCIADLLASEKLTPPAVDL